MRHQLPNYLFRRRTYAKDEDGNLNSAIEAACRGGIRILTL